MTLVDATMVIMLHVFIDDGIVPDSILHILPFVNCLYSFYLTQAAWPIKHKTHIHTHNTETLG